MAVGRVVDEERLFRELLVKRTGSQEKADLVMKGLLEDPKPTATMESAVKEYLKSGGRGSPETRDTYGRVLQAFIRLLKLADLPCSDLTVSHLEAFLSGPRERDRTKDDADIQYRAGNTYNKERAALSSFLRWAKQQKFVDENLALLIPRSQVNDAQDPVALTPAEQRQLLKLAGASKRLGLRHLTLAILFIYTGLRVSEMCRLRWSSINFEENFMSVVGKGKKTRDVPLLPQAKDALKEYRDKYRANQRSTPGYEDYVFVNTMGDRKGLPMTRNGVQKLFRPWFEALGKPKGISVHCLRHTFAVNLFWLGVEPPFIQAALGHTNPETTVKYLRIPNRQMVKVFNERFRSVQFATDRDESEWQRAYREILPILKDDKDDKEE